MDECVCSFFLNVCSFFCFVFFIFWKILILKSRLFMIKWWSVLEAIGLVQKFEHGFHIADFGLELRVILYQTDHFVLDEMLLLFSEILWKEKNEFFFELLIFKLQIFFWNQDQKEKTYFEWFLNKCDIVEIGKTLPEKHFAFD